MYGLQAQTPFTTAYDSSSYRDLLESMAHKGNGGRYRTIKKTIKNTNNESIEMNKEWIDWFGLYKNLVIEKKGESDSIIYVICHYDHLDANVFAFANLFINGYLDYLLTHLSFSKGAYDNGSGIAISLGVLNKVMQKDMHYTYRFLFAGMEEYGLRGSRRHVSGLKMDEWDRVICAINIDMVGKKGQEEISIINVTDEVFMDVAREVSYSEDIPLKVNRMPGGAASDFVPFQGQNFGKDFLFSFGVNLSGAFIPQKSYFTKKKEGVPIIDFTDHITFSITDMVGIFSPVSFGQIHSYKDHLRVLDCKSFERYSHFIFCVIEMIDNNRGFD